jgi:hypothetical protein
MPGTSLELHFAGNSDVQLIETRFEGPWTKAPTVAIRGKTLGAFKNVGTFQWTSAVRALCVLSIRAVIAKSSHDAIPAQLSGLRASLAASLDYALSKQPGWVRELCGADTQGDAYMRKLIIRTNPERKRAGPVILALNERVLRAEDIRVFWERKEIRDVGQLGELLRAIDTEAAPSNPTGFLNAVLSKVA